MQFTCGIEFFAPVEQWFNRLFTLHIFDWLLKPDIKSSHPMVRHESYDPALHGTTEDSAVDTSILSAPLEVSVAEAGMASMDDVGIAAAASPTNVVIRGTMTGNLAKSTGASQIRNFQDLDHVGVARNRPYIVQLVLTCLPLLLADLISLLLAVGITGAVGFEWLNPLDATSRAIIWLPTVALSMVLINGVLGLYPGTRFGTVEEIQRLTLSSTIVGLILASRLRPDSILFGDRVAFLLFAFAIALFLAPIIRSRVRQWLAKTSWWGFPTLVCGDHAAVVGVCQWLEDNRRLGLRPVGLVTDPEVMELNDDTPWPTGNWREAKGMARRERAFWAILVESGDDVHDVASTIERHLGNVPHVLVVSELTGIPDHWDRHQMNESLPGFLFEQHLSLPVQQIVKRGMDLLIATIAGLLLAPLLLGLAVMTKLSSRGPIFFGHNRIGLGNTRFKAWKFRTMVSGAEQMIEDYLAVHPELRGEWERDHKLKNDPRVTPLGRFMRKWSIDELPQIWNVFRGEMSIVGPRPIVEDEITKYGEHFDTFCTVLPGLTGMWQVCGRNDTTYDERVQLDVYYIHHWSPWLDLYLLARTIKAVLFTKGAY